MHRYKLVLFAALCLTALLCRPVSKSVHAVGITQKDLYGPPKVIGTIKNPSVSESSGLVASRTMPGVYWTHNDSGDGPFIYAVDSSGDSFGVWRVTGAEAVDWEDISIGPGLVANKTYLYVGDIGDNNSSRNEIVVYRVEEPKPDVADSKSSTTKPRLTERAEAIRLRYPDGKRDAETLLVHPTSGNIYIINKIALQNPAIYEAVAPFNTAKPITMRRIGELKLPSLFGGILTGGSVSPDGKRIALCDYFQGYEIVLPATSSNFDDIWKQSLTSFDFGKRKQGESIAYRLDGRALLGTSEGRGSPLIEVVRK